MANTQIYSATYSNVPVFEFVTPEGPIMRRKSDSWINATHILKIAKFPKAKRTRILEKDVQTGTHEKVQGGYGKYQGTYVPLELGVEIAKNFGVYEILRPIFEFKYVEGKSETPPPAPKHSHASASNVAKRQASLVVPARKTKSMTSLPGEPPKKRGRPKRITLKTKPTLQQSDTTPIETSGPSIGTFKKSDSFSQPRLSRQDTEQDNLQVMANNMNIKDEDLELVESEDDNEQEASQGELMSGKELFGTPRDSFEKIVQSHSHDPYGLSQYQAFPSNNNSKDELIFTDYFSSLLAYISDDNKIRSNTIPDKILNPPQPLSKININQPIDNEGNTIFHWVCSMASVLIIEFLLSMFDIPPDLRNNNGETPLMFLVKFSNSYQLKNFPTLLDLLFDSILLVDNSGKTVLHHITLIDTKNKERFSRYYMEALFAKIFEFQEDEEIPDKKELIAKFINHQDSDGNTAFHIAAYNLNKKCVKVFISYHRFIDFSLRNLVSYTVEDYLASHNYVLRLDKEEPVEDDFKLPQNALSTQSFESHLYYSKMAVNSQNTTSNLITEKLAELSYTIDKELSEKDEKILSLFKLLKIINHEKLLSQKSILSFFNLEYLIEDVESSFNSSNSHDIIIEEKKDKVLQGEIHRLINDLSFQHLQKKNELEMKLNEYKDINEKIQLAKLKKLESIYINEQTKTDDNDKFNLSVELTEQILKRKELLDKVFKEQLNVPLSNDEFKENKVNSKSIVSNYPKDDKLNKYCKLISLCCGMDFNEVENSIDLIEQSLVKSNK